MDGKFKIYNKNGVVIEELQYKLGKKHEECKYFYDDGKPLQTENWNMGMKVGEFKIFYYSGKRFRYRRIMTRKVEKRVGSWSITQTAWTKRKILYEKDVLLEEHRYDEQGRETYSFGEPEGDQMEDDENAFNR